MKTTLVDADRPEPWLKKRKAATSTTRETRNSAKAVQGAEITAEPGSSEMPSAPRRGRKKSQAKQPGTIKGLKTTKPMAASTVAVVLGRGKNPIQDVLELRRKNEEDALACGRVVRTVANPVAQKQFPSTSSTVLDENTEEGLRPPVPVAVPSSVGTNSAIPEPGGIYESNKLNIVILTLIEIFCKVSDEMEKCIYETLL